MSTKATIRFQREENGLPAWHLYEELFDPADVVYLELEGVQADLSMIGNIEVRPGTVVLRLPSATAKQLGLVPAAWKKEKGNSG
jgi:hypothetical protein